MQAELDCLQQASGTLSPSAESSRPGCRRIAMVYVHSQVQSLLRLLPHLASQVVAPRNPRFVSRVCLRVGPTGCISRGTFNECFSSRVFYDVFKPDVRKYITGSSTPPPPLSFHRVGRLDLLTQCPLGQCIAQKQATLFDQW